MMRGWLIYAKKDAIKNERYINFHVEEGKKRGIDFEVIFIEKLEIGIRDNRTVFLYEGVQKRLPDFAIVRIIYPLLTEQLESLGVPTFNNSFVARTCNDKAKTYQYVSRLKIPMIETTFVRAEDFNQKIQMISDEKVVIKAVAGHGGSQVFLYDPKSENKEMEANAIREGLSGCDVVIQPLTGSKHQDLRVYVIGKEIIAAVLRTSKEGFRSNFSLGGEVCLYKLSSEQEANVKKIIHIFEFGLVGIDFLIGDDGTLIFNEIEDVVGARMLYQCSDINLVGKYLEFIQEKIKVDKKN